jgi:pSer/pThr/pTyr-binding forkhead associated (FHA) protein
MPAQLLALTDGPSILLDKPILLLGRHGECDVQLNSRKVSRRHCCIAQVNDYLVVRDLGSTNGVRINGQRVIDGRLNAGDELTVGNFRYQVFLESGNGAVLAAAHPRSEESRLEEAEVPIALDDAAGAGRKILASKPALPAQTFNESFVLPDSLRNPTPPLLDEESSSSI